MKKIVIFTAFLTLFLSGCIQQTQAKKANFQNPDPKKYSINSNGCLKRKTLWRQLGI